MIKSKYTFTTRRKDTGALLIVNYLTGALDEVEKNEEDELLRRLASNDWENYSLASHLLEQGYLFTDERAERDLIQEKYLDFQKEYEATPVQLIFSVTYTCNFACPYCFQEEYAQNKGFITAEITDAFFSHINERFSSEKVRPYITLFGGEPLPDSPARREALLYFLDRAKQYGYEIAFVTNGFSLVDYIPVFKARGYAIREIQTSLDGGREDHDSRRTTKNGKPTFDRIAVGIDMALENGFRVNLRSILDKRNMNSLWQLAEFAKNRGWLSYPSLFETTLGRNYELHTCQHTDSLYDRVEMWAEFYELAKKHPVLREFHRPQFHGMRYLNENGEMPMPIFDGCPAGKKEWAFDVNGDIYGCTASVGVAGYKLGSFLNPEEPLDESRVYSWNSRSVLTIPECKNCAVSLSCGGGCAVVAANKSGKIQAPDCRPVADLVGLGVAHYAFSSET